MSPGFPGMLTGSFTEIPLVVDPRDPVSTDPRPDGIEYISIVHGPSGNDVKGPNPPSVNQYGAATTYNTEFEAAYDDSSDVYPAFIGLQTQNISIVRGNDIPGLGQQFQPTSALRCDVPPHQRTLTGKRAANAQEAETTKADYRRRSECGIDYASERRFNFYQGDTHWVDISIYPDLFQTISSASYSEVLQWKAPGGTPPIAVNVKYQSGQPYWCLDGSASPTLIDGTKPIIAPVAIGEWQRFTIGVKFDSTSNGHVWVYYNGNYVFDKARPTLRSAGERVWMQHGIYETGSYDSYHHRVYTSQLRVASTRDLAMYRSDMIGA
jgi:Polysaccharide lyase